MAGVRIRFKQDSDVVVELDAALASTRPLITVYFLARRDDLALLQPALLEDLDHSPGNRVNDLAVESDAIWGHASEVKAAARLYRANCPNPEGRSYVKNTSENQRCSGGLPIKDEENQLDPRSLRRPACVDRGSPGRRGGTIGSQRSSSPRGGAPEWQSKYQRSATFSTRSSDETGSACGACFIPRSTGLRQWRSTC